MIKISWFVIMNDNAYYIRVHKMIYILLWYIFLHKATVFVKYAIYVICVSIVYQISIVLLLCTLNLDSYWYSIVCINLIICIHINNLYYRINAQSRLRPIHENADDFGMEKNRIKNSYWLSAQLPGYRMVPWKGRQCATLS